MVTPVEIYGYGIHFLEAQKLYVEASVRADLTQDTADLAVEHLRRTLAVSRLRHLLRSLPDGGRQMLQLALAEFGPELRQDTHHV